MLTTNVYVLVAINCFAEAPPKGESPSDLRQSAMHWRTARSIYSRVVIELIESPLPWEIPFLHHHWSHLRTCLKDKQRYLYHFSFHYLSDPRWSSVESHVMLKWDCPGLEGGLRFITWKLLRTNSGHFTMLMTWLSNKTSICLCLNPFLAVTNTNFPLLDFIGWVSTLDSVGLKMVSDLFEAFIWFLNYPQWFLLIHNATRSVEIFQNIQ